MDEFALAVYMIDEYLDHLKKSGRKEYTLKTYRNLLRKLAGFLKASGLTCDPRKIGENEIQYIVDNYLASENTIHHYITILGAWLVFNNNNVMSKMSLLWNKQGCPNAKWIKQYELGQLMSRCRNPTERMMFVLGAYCGLRRAEIVGIKASDYKGEILTVTGKGHMGGKTRIIPMSAKMREEMDAYLKYRSSVVDGCEGDRSGGTLLIVKRYGKYAYSLSPTMVSRVVQRISSETGIECTPHSLRRLFATMLNDKTELQNIQHLMGHANINTTARYIDRDVDKLKQALDAIY